MIRYISIVALLLSGCATSLEMAGTPPVVAQAVEVALCETAPPRIQRLDGNARMAAEIIMAMACPQHPRASLISDDPFTRDVDRAWACVTTTYLVDGSRDAFDRARKDVCGA